MQPTSYPAGSWLSRPLSVLFSPTLENLLALALLLLAVFTRFAQLGDRSMSHDEINHVVPAYEFSQGRGYQYSPITHGPFQFHVMALSYFLFGDNDFTSRIPAALFSVTTVGIGAFAFRRYLGRAGALAAGLLFLISPYMLFYGRYARNEAFIVVWASLTLLAMLWYLETGQRRALALFTLANALHFTDKATAYIFAAEQIVFLVGYLLYRIEHCSWKDPRHHRYFLLALLGSLLFFTGAAWLYTVGSSPWFFIPLVVGGILSIGLVVVFLFTGLGEHVLRQERSLDLLLLLASLVLPLLAALPVRLLGFDPLDYSSSGIFRSGTVLLVLLLAGAAVGLWWNARDWPVYAALFLGPFVVLYTTLFTHLNGLGAGIFGALGYWMEQQAVQRGEQPLYYYALLQIPLYEFLPLVGTLAAALIAWRKGRPMQKAVGSVYEENRSGSVPTPVPTLALLLFWSLSSLVVFTLAGEKMPWLTIHIALPMILSTAWVVQYFSDRWQGMGRSTAGGVALAIFVVLAILTARTAYRAAFILYDQPLEYLVYAHAAPDPKRLLAEIEAISRKTTGGLDMIIAYDNHVRYPYWWYLRHYPNRVDYDEKPDRDLRRAAIVLAGEENYARVESILGEDYLQFEYPRLWWPNQDYWALKWTSINAERKAAAGASQEALAPMTLGQYLGLSWQHISPYLLDTASRNALWQIWLNRNYEPYAQLHPCQTCSLFTWRPANRMRMYLRKDIAAQVWGSASEQPAVVVDPYAPYRILLEPDRWIGGAGTEEGQFQSPRGIASAPDGSLYIADSKNHRVQHLAQDGKVLQVWGTFSDLAWQAAPGGTFNEPWGVAVGPDGSVYVADTWNHRIQKFTAAGAFIRLWGTFGQGDEPGILYGPRGIAVDPEGRVFVTDTGNKRVIVYDSEGDFLFQSGSQVLDEPVGIAVGTNGQVYVADTWNQQVAVFAMDETQDVYRLQATWPVEGWSGQSLENKPFLAVLPSEEVLATDPEGCQGMAFSLEGAVHRVWGACGEQIGMPSGIAVDPLEGLWISDVENHRLIHYP